jgi:hypothetical protein
MRQRGGCWLISLSILAILALAIPASLCTCGTSLWVLPDEKVFACSQNCSDTHWLIVFHMCCVLITRCLYPLLVPLLFVLPFFFL